MKFYTSTQKTVDTFFSSNDILDVTSSMSQIIIFFYQSTSLFLKNIKNILDVYAKDVMDPLNQYKIKIGPNYKTILDELNEIFAKYKTTKNKYEKIKEIYYNSCNNLFDYHVNKIGNKFELQSIVDNYMQIYKYEIQHSNNCYIYLDDEYNKIQETIKATEENRLIFYQYILSNFSKCIKDLSNNTIEFSNQLNEKLRNWKIEEDIKYYEEEYNYSDNNNKRFETEIFEKYDPSVNNQSKSKEYGLFYKGKKIFEYLGDYEIVDKYQIDDFQDEVANSFIRYLESDKEINMED